MPKVSRERDIDATPEEIYRVITDPEHLPRWWPRTTRVENVNRGANAKRMRWTQVMKTAKGSIVRADYQSTIAKPNQRFAWKQELEDTPFEKFLRHLEVVIDLSDHDGGSRVRITSDQKAKGMSRLGGVVMRGGIGRTLNDALEGLDRAVGGGS